jgi:hypothetical protein
VDYDKPIEGSNQYVRPCLAREGIFSTAHVSIVYWELVIDHRRGQEEAGYVRSSFSRIDDYSDCFRDYDEILVNNDKFFHAREEAQRQFSATLRIDLVLLGVTAMRPSQDGTSIGKDRTLLLQLR